MIRSFLYGLWDVIRDLWTTLYSFPLFLLGQVIGMVHAILSDTEVFWLTVAGVLLGFAVGPFIAGAVAISFWVYLRTEMTKAKGISSQISNVAMVIRDKKF